MVIDVKENNMDFLGILTGISMIAVTLTLGFLIFFRRDLYFKYSKKYSEIYRSIGIFNWWIDFVYGHPWIELAFVFLFCVIFLTGGILILFVSINGPIDVYW
jgi:hypothetical protein